MSTSGARDLCHPEDLTLVGTPGSLLIVLLVSHWWQKRYCNSDSRQASVLFGPSFSVPRIEEGKPKPPEILDVVRDGRLAKGDGRRTETAVMN